MSIRQMTNSIDRAKELMLDIHDSLHSTVDEQKESLAICSRLDKLKKRIAKRALS